MVQLSTLARILLGHIRAAVTKRVQYNNPSTLDTHARATLLSQSTVLLSIDAPVRRYARADHAYTVPFVFPFILTKPRDLHNTHSAPLLLVLPVSFFGIECIILPIRVIMPLLFAPRASLLVAPDVCTANLPAYWQLIPTGPIRDTILTCFCAPLDGADHSASIHNLLIILRSSKYAFTRQHQCDSGLDRSGPLLSSHAGRAGRSTRLCRPLRHHRILLPSRKGERLQHGEYMVLHVL